MGTTLMVRRCRVAAAVVLALFALVLAGPAIAHADEGAKADANRLTLTVGVPTDRCPISYSDPSTGEPVGIGVDLMRVAAGEAGYDVRFVSIGSATLKQALDNPDYDIVLPFGSAIKSAAGATSVVTDNLMQTPFTLVTIGKRETPALETLRVGMLSSQSGVGETVRQLHPGIEITFFDTMDQSVAALRKGEVDALLQNSYVWSYVLQKPSYADLTVQPAAMFAMDYRAGTLDTPEGQALVERLNEGIAEIGDQREQAIVLDYTSRRLYQYDFFDYIYLYGIVIGLIVLLLLAIIAFSIQRHRALVLRQEERMRLLVDHDPLTGALSLNGFRKHARDMLRDHPNISYFMIYLNVKNFKYINDSQGMEAGDDLLKFVAERLKEYLSDVELFCRIEGDHFAVLLHAMDDNNEYDFEDIVINPVRSYFVDRGIDSHVLLCGGAYVLTPSDYQTADIDHMLDCARVAEKRVRTTSTDGYQFYNPEQWEHDKWVADIVSRLPRSLANGEIIVWYQPQVDYRTGEVTGAEALCRWNHGTLGWVSPADFIPVLEEAGLVFDLDRFVWETVCEDLHRWNKTGHHMSVSVNLSRCDIGNGVDIPEHFASLVQKYGLTNDQLRVEVTETAFVEDAQLLIATAAQLRELGFVVEMDDFGSGYSSLNMLKEVPVDRIKLDLNFLSGIGDLERGRIILSFMIELVDCLCMSVIAEGVETNEQADFLKSRGCFEMQGYCFYKPMPVDDFEREVLVDKSQHDPDRS